MHVIAITSFSLTLDKFICFLYINCLLGFSKVITFSFRFVENEILSILRRRFEDCILYEAPDHRVKCQELWDQYNEGAENWFIKCK
jgi:hypothetical protein